MPIRRAALAALLTLLLVPPVLGRESVSPGPPAEGRGAPGPPAASALESLLPRRCGVCHLDKAPTGAAGRIAFKPPGGPGGAGDAAVCYSCHNGIVSDDRRDLWSGRHHPSSGKVTCGSCHTPHLQETNVRPFMRYPQGSYAFCATCHPGRRAGDAGEHPAVAGEKGGAQDCGGCHAVHRAQGDGLIRAASAESLCGPCHGDNPSRAGRGPGLTTHVTGKSGPPCLGCHRVHRTAGGRKLLDKAALEGRLCRQCHERNFSSVRSEANHPVASDQAICLSCHRMHNAEKPGARRGLLATAWTEPDTACRRCHADVVGPGKGGAWNHPVGASVAKDERALGARLAKSGAFFAPGGLISCLSCHRAHAGRVGTPQLVTTREALCLYCHPAQNSLDPETAALGAHPISVKPRRARVDESFIKAGGTTGPGGELTCTTCHRAHRGRPSTPGLVIPRESYSCLLCHAREASIASTPHSTARAPQAEDPAAGGLCGGCHGEHGWRVPLGAAVEGQSAIERLCAACHAAGPAGTTNHPLGTAPPPGRGTAGLPLFWSDGRRYRQGVITCATCHDVHRAGPDGRFLRESLAGSGRDLCVGCHAAQAVVAKTPHDLEKTQGTTCGPCHSVHDPLAVASWPAARGGGDRAAADLGDFCGVCHRADGAAAGAVVAERFHPVSPVAGVKGGKSVGCGGCHDPHRWNPADPADRGASGAGSAATKFLVRSAGGPADLCVGCHAAQAAVAGTPHDLTQAGPKGRTSASPEALRSGICAPCHSVHGRAAARRGPRATAEAGRDDRAGERPLRDLPRRGQDRRRRDHRRARASGRREPGAGLRAGPAAVRLLRQASDRRKNRLRDLSRPAQLVPVGGSGATTKAATSFLRHGCRRLRPAVLPLPRRKVDGRRHGSRPAGHGPDGRESRRAGTRRRAGFAGSATPCTGRRRPGRSGIAGSARAATRAAAPAPAVIGPATTSGRTCRPAPKRIW